MTHSIAHRLSTFQGTLMVIGTAIGGGMLGLPVMTSLSGFFPSACMFLVSWFFMTCTGLIIAEFCCRTKENANLVTIYSSAFPRIGKVIVTIVYFLLFYSLMVAYLLALSRMMMDLTGMESDLLPFHWYLCSVATIGFLLLVGLRSWITKINGTMVGIMALSYVIFILMALALIDVERLFYQKWESAWLTLPLIFTSFGFQGTVPSLAGLMGYDRKAIFSSILIGSTVTLIVYFFWQLAIIGAIPLEGHMGLEHARVEGLDAISPLQYHLPDEHSTWLMLFGKIFAWTSIATSLLGVSIGMQDFIADLFSVRHKSPKSRVIFAFSVYIPALFFSYMFPGAFLTALAIAGGIGCAFLLGLFPSLVAYTTLSEDDTCGSQEKCTSWVDRLIKALQNPIFLLISILFFTLEIITECVTLVVQ